MNWCDSMKANSMNTKFLFLLLLGFLFSFPFASAAPAYSSVDIQFSKFLVLGIGSLVMLLLGILARSPLLSILGAVGLLISGFLMLQGHVMFPVGHVENVSGSVTTLTTTYDHWDDGNNELFGFFIVVACAGLLWTLASEYSGD